MIKSTNFCRPLITLFDQFITVYSHQMKSALSIASATTANITYPV